MKGLNVKGVAALQKGNKFVSHRNTHKGELG